MEPAIARFGGFQMLANDVMKLRQLVEWDRGQGVMFRVEGHVPGKEAYDRISESGPRIFQHISDMGAARMFRQ